MPELRPDIAVVVPAYNAWPDLHQCLTRVLAAAEAYGGADIVVLDNGSTDGSWERLVSDFGGRVRAIQESRATVARLRNIGAQAARGTIISFIDADCVVCDNYFDAIAETMQDPDIDACGSPYELPDHPRWIEQTWHALHVDRSEAYVSYLNAGNFAIRRDAFERCGGFREDLITGEDAELGKRLNDMGARILRTPRVQAVHLGNPKTLRAFFRQQRWHGLGQFGTVRLTSLDRPALMTALHAAVIAGAVLALVLQGLAGLVPAMTLPWVIPGATVFYRSWLRRRLVSPLRAALLYQCYYLARITAAILLVTGVKVQRR